MLERFSTREYCGLPFAGISGGTAMTRPHPALLVLAAGLLGLGACATPRPQPSPALQNETRMQPDTYGRAGLLWTEARGFDWTRFRAVQIDPVRIDMRRDRRRKALAPEMLEALAREFREAVTTELGSDYPEASVPGPDVLRIRAVITDVIPARPALNALTTAVAFVPLDLGGATIEVEFLDSESGERLAAMVERKRGSPMNLRGGFSELGHARAAFREWAVELRRALETNP